MTTQPICNSLWCHIVHDYPSLIVVGVVGVEVEEAMWVGVWMMSMDDCEDLTRQSTRGLKFEGSVVNM